MKISFSKFVLAVNLFILEVQVHRAYKELGIVYNTAYKIESQDKACNISLCIKGGYKVSS